MRVFPPILSLILIAASISAARAADIEITAKATNQFGVDLYRQLSAADDKLCLSPYSLQSAMAMTFAGSEGETREEMANVLHFATDSDQAIHASFASLRSALDDMAKTTVN